MLFLNKYDMHAKNIAVLDLIDFYRINQHGAVNIGSII